LNKQFEKFLADAPELAKSLGRCVVTLSYAQSLDGSLTALPGSGTAWSGKEAFTLTHRLRASHQAILAGIGTVLADNPRLTVRLVEGRNPQPVILDSHLRIPIDSHLLYQKSNFPWIAALADANPARRAELESLNARIILCPSDSGGEIDLKVLLEKLFEWGITTLMVEGGARVITSFLQERLVDYAVITLANVWSGGTPVISKPLLSDSRNEKRLLPCLLDMKCEILENNLVLWGKLGETEI
jgi:GTP cyclohydrolase II